MVNNEKFLAQLASMSDFHGRGSVFFASMEKELLEEIPSIHGLGLPEEIFLGGIGVINFPYFSMGNIDSTKLFGLDELILFSFYFVNRTRYKKALDLGANIGLHSLLLKKIGFEVVSYEPDQIHVEQFEAVMKMNGLDSNGLRRRAISDKRGSMEYIRILGNTTGSHLLGSKENVYGPTEIVSVDVDDILEVLSEGNFDFVKMDVEGHEVVLLNRITAESISKTDIMLEIGSEKNAADIFSILREKKIPAYAQKINWKKVENLEDLPSHHSHGSVFLSLQGPPNWK